MPHRSWIHRCPVIQSSVQTGQQTRCTTCGQPAVYEGWRLTMHEAMARYQSFYGLKPIGSHRAMADKLLGAISRWCPSCDGMSIINDRETDTWRPCRACGGLGRLWAVDDAQVAAAREQILQKYPQAGAPPVERFLSGAALALRLDSDSMVDLESSTQ